MTSSSIELWRSVTGISDDDFSLLATLADGGTPFSFADTPTVPQQLYIYKARRYDAALNAYSAFSPLAFARGPWPHTGASPMTTTNTGIQSILGIGREVTEGAAVLAQKGIDRKSGSLDIEFQDPDHVVLRNIDTDIEEVPGTSKVGPAPIKVTLSPEGLSGLLCSLYGDPTTTPGGGTAPVVPVPTTATTGGTLPASTSYYVKTAYVIPDFVGIAADAGTASTEATIATGAGTATNTVTVPSPATQAGATGYNVYIGTATGQETLQNAAPLAIGTPFVLTAPPTATGLPAPAAYNIHTWKSQLTQKPQTLLEKRGASIYAFAGAVCNELAVSVDKTQNTPVEGDFSMQALNQVVMDTLAAVGLDTAGFDVLPAFGPAQAFVLIAGNVNANAKQYSCKLTKNMKERHALNGKRGPVGNYPVKADNTGSLSLYFQDESAMIVFFGQLDGVSAPYGATRKRRTVSIVLALRGEPNAAGFRNWFIITATKAAYKKVGKPVQGPDEIMQSVDWKAYYDSATQTSIQIQVANSQSNASIVAAGTAIGTIPASDVQ